MSEKEISPVKSNESLFAVVLEPSQDIQVPLISEILSKFWEIPFIDSSVKARNSWGIIEENLNSTQADDLLKLFSQKQINALKLPMDGLIPPIPPALIQSLDFQHDHLKIVMRGSEGKSLDVDYKSVKVLVAAFERETQIKTVEKTDSPNIGKTVLRAGLFLSTGIVAFGSKKRVEEIKEEGEPRFFLDIFGTDPLRRFRVQADILDYSFLKEKKEVNAFQNFRILVKELASRAPKALLNKGMKVLLAGQPINTMGYQSPQDVERECRWLLALTDNMGQ